MIQNVAGSASLYKAQSKQNISFGKKKQKSTNNKRSTNNNFHVTPSKILAGLAVLGALNSAPALQSCSSKDDVKPETPAQVDSTDTDEIKYDIITPTTKEYAFTTNESKKYGENIIILDTKENQYILIQANNDMQKNINITSKGNIKKIGLQSPGSNVYLREFTGLDTSDEPVIVLYGDYNEEELKEISSIVKIDDETFLKFHFADENSEYKPMNLFYKVGDANTSESEIEDNIKDFYKTKYDS